LPPNKIQFLRYAGKIAKAAKKQDSNKANNRLFYFDD
jgi:hypothetical protein